MNKKCRDCGAQFYAEEAWKKICLSCWKKKQPPRTNQSDTNKHPKNWALLDDAMLKRLINLCHPDRHANSEKSTLATQWLLGIKAEREK